MYSFIWCIMFNLQMAPKGGFLVLVSLIQANTEEVTWNSEETFLSLKTLNRINLLGIT